MNSKLPYRNDFGSLVISSWFYPKWTESKFDRPYLFIAPEQKIILETNLRIFPFYAFVTSPDQTQLAIFKGYQKEDDKDDLFIFDKNGKIIARFDLPNNFDGGRIVYWLKEGMLFEITSHGGSYNESHDYVLYDPFKKEQLALKTNFPNRYAPDLNYRGNDKVYYDPALSRAIYFARDKATGKLYYSLWDLSTNQEIAQFRLTSYSQGITWSSDGAFAITYVWLGNQYGLVKIYRNGQTETLVSGEVHSIRLSPDSNFLAYWLPNDYPTDFYTLHVKNLETSNIQNLCLQTDYLVGMIWSPDSKNLAASFEYEGDVITTIINFEERTAVRIDDVAIPVGWLK